MNITTILKNEMKEIIGRVEKRIGNKIYTYAKVKVNGRLKMMYVGVKNIAPTSTNMNPKFS